MARSGTWLSPHGWRLCGRHQADRATPHGRQEARRIRPTKLEEGLFVVLSSRTAPYRSALTLPCPPPVPRRHRIGIDPQAALRYPFKFISLIGGGTECAILVQRSSSPLPPFIVVPSNAFAGAVTSHMQESVSFFALFEQLWGDRDTIRKAPKLPFRAILSLRDPYLRCLAQTLIPS